MAKSRPQKAIRNPASQRLHKTLPSVRKIKTPSAEDLLAQSSVLLQTSQPDEALSYAERALGLLNASHSPKSITTLQALTLLASIYLALGDSDSARKYFLRTTTLDPSGDHTGAEPALWLAQLSEEGGLESKTWFEKGITTLRREISNGEEKNDQLAAALCGLVELYMTDLSWELDAESRCEALVTEALLVAPYSAEALQTFASVKISQGRTEEARKALGESMRIWQGKENNEGRPEFAVRISLSRLLMEVGMLSEGMEVLEGLVEEDDESVEAWYLGGWCLFLGATEKKEKHGEEIEYQRELRASRDWLNNTLRLYRRQEYEDERLKEHTMELIGELKNNLGDGLSEEDDDEWEDNSNDDDDDRDKGDEEDRHMNGT